jgi:CheY-like chemotaxis protein
MPTILLIEDNALFRKAARLMLVTAGYDVQKAADGKAGLGCYRQHHSDVVIADLVMPEREGLETIQELPAFGSPGEDHRDVRLSPGPPLFDAAIEFGARRILRKPFTVDQLLATVTEVLAT